MCSAAFSFSHRDLAYVFPLPSNILLCPLYVRYRLPSLIVILKGRREIPPQRRGLPSSRFAFIPIIWNYGLNHCRAGKTPALLVKSKGGGPKSSTDGESQCLQSGHLHLSLRILGLVVCAIAVIWENCSLFLPTITTQRSSSHAHR